MPLLQTPTPPQLRPDASDAAFASDAASAPTPYSSRPRLRPDADAGPPATLASVSFLLSATATSSAAANSPASHLSVSTVVALEKEVKRALPRRRCQGGVQDSEALRHVLHLPPRPPPAATHHPPRRRPWRAPDRRNLLQRWVILLSISMMHHRLLVLLPRWGQQGTSRPTSQPMKTTFSANHGWKLAAILSSTPGRGRNPFGFVCSTDTIPNVAAIRLGPKNPL